MRISRLKSTGSYIPIASLEPFIALSMVSALVFFLGIKRFVRDMQSTYAALNKAPSSPIDARLFITTFLGQMPAIIRHDRFSDCIENKRRKISHMLTQFLRLADIAWAAYSMYFIHILLAFNLMAFLPFTKLAHLVYRTVAMTYQQINYFSGSKAPGFCP